MSSRKKPFTPMPKSLKRKARKSSVWFSRSRIRQGCMKRNNVVGSEKRKAFVLRLRTQTIDSVKAGGALRASGSRTLGILKNLVVGTGIFAVASLSSFWPWQTEREESLEKGNLQPMHSDPSASLDSLPKAPGDASASKSAYTYTCFGLWADSKTGPTPSVQQRRQDIPSSTPDTPPASAMPSSPSDDQKPVGEGESLGALDTTSARSVQEDTTRISSRREGQQGKSRPKSHNGRNSKSQGLRFADIKSRLRTLWHQFLARSK
jgi:hypothetical protein